MFHTCATRFDKIGNQFSGELNKAMPACACCMHWHCCTSGRHCRDRERRQPQNLRGFGPRPHASISAPPGRPAMIWPPRGPAPHWRRAAVSRIAAGHRRRRHLPPACCSLHLLSPLPACTAQIVYPFNYAQQVPLIRAYRRFFFWKLWRGLHPYRTGGFTSSSLQNCCFFSFFFFFDTPRASQLASSLYLSCEFCWFLPVA